MMTVREFAGAWRGIWLFTWRAQLTWRKLVSRVLLLLALPLLICVTLRSPEDWVQMHPMFGDPIDVEFVTGPAPRASSTAPAPAT